MYIESIYVLCWHWHSLTFPYSWYILHRCNDGDETMLCVYGLMTLSVERPPTIPLSVEGPPTIPLSVEGPPTIPPSVEGPPTIPPIVEGPLPMPPSIEDTAMIKSGFKGKHANKKFGWYGKRGGNKKLNYSPPDRPTDDNSEHGFLQQICPTTTGRKVIKKQIILRLSIVTSSCQEAQQWNQVTLSLNCSLIKKVSKSKEVVEGLCTCLKECRQEMHSTKSDLVNALQDNVSTKNTSLSREQEDQSLIAAIKKDAEATLERGHAIVTATIISKSKLKMAAAETKHKCVVNIITQCHRS